jgi:glycerol-3-phosphate O-acyltransferase / dihydroxyacetone phosphate acyltransferase
MRQIADGIMTRLASLLTHVFFRHVDVEGEENLPRRGPLVVVANHTNGLVDGLLLMATLRRYPRFLGKSTLFRILPLRPFLKLAGVVPVYRRSDHDGDEGPDRNEATFRTSRELLARGGVVALFPEGISHNEPALQPLRTGAARIALSAADEGTAALVTVAVGLVYDHKATFRSRALVRVGPPRPVAPLVGGYRSDPRAAVRGLTDDMADQLHQVVTTYRSWREAEVLAAIADLVVAGGPGSDAEGEQAGLAEREQVVARLASVDLDATDAGRALKRAYEEYRRDLALMGLSDAQVTARYGGNYRRALAWSLFKVAIALPPGLVGALVHAVPYQIMKRLGKLPRNESIKSTVKLLGCFALFNVNYLVIAEVVRRKRGWLAGAIAFVAAPLSGYATLRLSERAKSAGGLIEGAGIVRSRRAFLPTVLAHRAEVVRQARVIATPDSVGDGRMIVPIRPTA